MLGGSLMRFSLYDAEIPLFPLEIRIGDVFIEVTLICLRTQEDFSTFHFAALKIVCWEK